jgi:hypothetical protein
MRSAIGTILLLASASSLHAQQYDEETVRSTVRSGMPSKCEKALMLACSFPAHDITACNGVQTVGDSCRTLQTIQFRKEEGLPSELMDEMRYQCGDPATVVEVQYTSGWRSLEPAKFLDTLLRPAVVRLASPGMQLPPHHGCSSCDVSAYAY